MSLSISHKKTLDVGDIGVIQDQLPSFDDGPIDLKRWFANKQAHRPLELEIGSGKGTFLAQQATQTPNVNYIGIEYAKAFWRYAADRCRRLGLDNVKLVHTEAGSFLRHYVPDSCLRQLHVYFPDPWPKKRHHKRRLIQESFLRGVHRKLEPDGLVRIATDHAEYYQWMTEHIERTGELFDRLPFESPVSAGEGELIGTNFERKYRRQGRPFYTMMLKKRSV